MKRKSIERSKENDRRADDFLGDRCLFRGYRGYRNSHIAVLPKSAYPASDDTGGGDTGSNTASGDTNLAMDLAYKEKTNAFLGLANSGGRGGAIHFAAFFYMAGAIVRFLCHLHCAYMGRRRRE